MGTKQSNDLTKKGSPLGQNQDIAAGSKPKVDSSAATGEVKRSTTPVSKNDKNDSGPQTRNQSSVARDGSKTGTGAAATSPPKTSNLVIKKPAPLPIMKPGVR